MDKKIGVIIIVMVAVILGGIAYASIPQAEPQQNTAISGNATTVAFENNGDTWKHMVAVFDVAPTAGHKKNVYANLWVRPKGTAKVDLSSELGYGNQALPKNTKIQMKTYKNSGVPQLPQGVTDTQVITTTDPTQGGSYLSDITSELSGSQRIISNSASIVVQVKIIIIKVIIEGPLCLNTGGNTISVPANGNGDLVIPGSWLNLVI